MAVIRKSTQTVDTAELGRHEWRTFVWLYRYVEVYGRSPSMVEMTAGLETGEATVKWALGSLQRQGFVGKVDGRRGWFPLRTP